jgi:hypothetical protein
MPGMSRFLCAHLSNLQRLFCFAGVVLQASFMFSLLFSSSPCPFENADKVALAGRPAGAKLESDAATNRLSARDEIFAIEV